MMYRDVYCAGIYRGQSPKASWSWDGDGFMSTDICFCANGNLRYTSRLRMQSMFTSADFRIGVLKITIVHS